jgi:hypothetical protein
MWFAFAAVFAPLGLVAIIVYDGKNCAREENAFGRVFAYCLR